MKSLDKAENSSILSNGISIEDISVTFGTTKALDFVSFQIQFGSIHAILGENGAGKSTLMNILGGFCNPDAGRILLDGKPLQLGKTTEMQKAGVAMVHQHFMLVPRFTVEQNFALSAPMAPLLSPVARDHIEKCFSIAESLGWNIPRGTETGELPVGVQQRIEIVKALSSDAKIVIFDEPTAVLNELEVTELFRVFRTLKNEGRMVILIAHKLEEIIEIADRAAILRKGKLVGETEISSTTIEELRFMMMGPEPLEALQKSSEKVVEVAESNFISISQLTVKGDRGEVAINGIDLELLSGEILGIGGVDGNGQLELAEAIVGIRDFDGSITRNGHIAYIPQDRQKDGLALDLSIKENFLIAKPVPAAAIAGEMISKSKTRQMVHRLVENYNIKIGSMNNNASSLSGGNQQKIIVSRVMEQNPKIIVAMNPTRGLDFRSSEFVREMLVKACKNGAAIVLISTDRDEIGAISTRSVELSKGIFVETYTGESPSINS